MILILVTVIILHQVVLAMVRFSPGLSQGPGSGTTCCFCWCRCCSCSWWVILDNSLVNLFKSFWNLFYLWHGYWSLIVKLMSFVLLLTLQLDSLIVNTFTGLHIFVVSCIILTKSFLHQQWLAPDIHPSVARPRQQQEIHSFNSVNSIPFSKNFYFKVFLFISWHNNELSIMEIVLSANWRR